MKKLVDLLTEQTQGLREAYIARTKEWAAVEFAQLRKMIEDFNTSKPEQTSDYFQMEARVHRLPYSVTCYPSGNMEKYISEQVVKAEKHYANSIEKLALRIEKKGLNIDSLKMESTYLDPNMSTIITDGTKTVRAFTIAALPTLD
jgi:hypothetical protein